jgi:hypothetical protein
LCELLPDKPIALAGLPLQAPPVDIADASSLAPHQALRLKLTGRLPDAGPTRSQQSRHGSLPHRKSARAGVAILGKQQARQALAFCLLSIASRIRLVVTLVLHFALLFQPASSCPRTLAGFHLVQDNRRILARILNDIPQRLFDRARQKADASRLILIGTVSGSGLPAFPRAASVCRESVAGCLQPVAFHPALFNSPGSARSRYYKDASQGFRTATHAPRGIGLRTLMVAAFEIVLFGTAQRKRNGALI